MKFIDYLKLLSESSPSKRAIIDYPDNYPPQYGLTYRMQYGRKKKKNKNEK